MELTKLLSEQTVSVSLAIAVLWFYNKLVVDYLDERKQILEILRLERKEWLEKEQNFLDKLFKLNAESTAAIIDNKAEIQALRGKINEFMLKEELKKGTEDDNKSELRK